MPSSISRARAETGEDLPPEIKAQQQALADRWPEIEARLNAGPPPGAGAARRDAFLREWERTARGAAHADAVRALNPAARRSGTEWLQAVVDSAASPRL